MYLFPPTTLFQKYFLAPKNILASSARVWHRGFWKSPLYFFLFEP